MANKSNFQLLAENLSDEIKNLKREISFKKFLLEYSGIPNVDGMVDEYATTQAGALSNTGKIAGLGVGAAANASAIVANPRVVVQSLSLKGAEPFVISEPNIQGGIRTGKPIVQNLGFGMGLGYDQQTFNNTLNFIRQYSTVDSAMSDAETDDPEQSTYINWKTMNSAVHNYQSQRIKDQLARAGMFNGSITDPYSQGLADTYNLNLMLPGKLRKVVDDTANSILGKQTSKGKQVNGYVRNLSRGEFDRFANTWSQNSRKNK